MISEIQGELGTSHAFIINDGLEQFNIPRAYLGAEIEYDEKAKAHIIKKILPANLEVNMPNPLLAANCDIKEGDYIFSVNGIELNENNCIEQLLISTKVNSWVNLEIGADSKKKRIVEIKTISCENMLYYFQWKEKNRVYINNATNNSVGYIHVSDMQARGFKEFFQSYLNEYDKKAIIIDMRNNRGGHVSCLLLDQLQRKRLGIDHTRWHGKPEIPHESSCGAFILLINANTASDGEMFSHQFKMLNLGKIVGERTWGGVVGIMPRYALVDGTLTSQPEFATWFADNKYDLENTGVSPDVEVFNNVFEDKDYQLEKAIELALETKTTEYDLESD
jgi:tricorn protease